MRASVLEANPITAMIPPLNNAPPALVLVVVFVSDPVAEPVGVDDEDGVDDELEDDAEAGSESVVDESPSNLKIFALGESAGRFSSAA